MERGNNDEALRLCSDALRIARANTTLHDRRRHVHLGEGAPSESSPGEAASEAEEAASLFEQFGEKSLAH